MTDALKQAAQQAMDWLTMGQKASEEGQQALDTIEALLAALSAPQPAAPEPDDVRELRKWLNEEPNRPIDRAALARVLAAPQPAAQQSDPCAPPEIQEAIERGEFEPGHWTISAQRAIEKNPSGALRIIARLRDEVASLKAAPQPAQAVPLTDEQIVDEAVRQDWGGGAFCAGVHFAERAHGIKQPGSEE